jgi:hypothetical protein
MIGLDETFDFSQLDEHEFLNLRHLFTAAGRLLWVSGDTAKSPRLATPIGILRTIRLERQVQEPNLVTLEVVDALLPFDVMVSKMAEFINYQFLEDSSMHTNGEYCLFGNGVFCKASLVPSTKANQLASAT